MVRVLLPLLPLLAAAEIESVSETGRRNETVANLSDAREAVDPVTSVTPSVLVAPTERSAVRRRPGALWALCHLGDAAVQSDINCSEVLLPSDYLQVCGRWQCRDPQVDYCFFSGGLRDHEVAMANESSNESTSLPLQRTFRWRPDVPLEMPVDSDEEKGPVPVRPVCRWPRFPLRRWPKSYENLVERQAKTTVKSPRPATPARSCPEKSCCRRSQPFFRCDSDSGAYLSRIWHRFGDAMVSKLLPSSRSGEWQHCADEGQICLCLGEVRFGLEAFPDDAADVAQQWASETLVAKNGLVFCTEETFGGQSVPNRSGEAQATRVCQCHAVSPGPLVVPSNETRLISADNVSRSSARAMSEEGRFIRSQPYSDDFLNGVRYDYASMHAGARLVTHAKGLLHAKAVLSPDKSLYMLSPCETRSWFVISLLEDIFVEYVGLVTLELFASGYRHLQILGSNQYPTETWRLLGEIESNSTSNYELFDVGSRCQRLAEECWVRFLKIRVLSHHRMEDNSFCALTRFQVFGATATNYIAKERTAEDRRDRRVDPSLLDIARWHEEVARAAALPPSLGQSAEPLEPAKDSGHSDSTAGDENKEAKSYTDLPLALIKDVSTWLRSKVLHRPAVAPPEDDSNASAPKNGTAIANKMKRQLENVLGEKIASIKNLVTKTEELRKNYAYDPSLKETDYFNSKDLDGLPLAIDDRFSTKIEINMSSSVIHIPTDVYSGGVGIVNTIKWTSGLDKYFKENEMRNHSLLWQYFGSADGVYRVYPGFKWRNDSKQDIFDHRRRGWYIQGSSSPKDIVLILDLSGSMAGQKLSILKLAALSLLDTLQENDYVNIVAVYDQEPVMVCQLTRDQKTIEKGPDCRKELLQATAQNKKFLQYFIPKNAFAKGIARASKGFELAIEVLQESRIQKPDPPSSNCTQAVILFTDGIEDSESKKSKEKLQEKNPDKKIRVFTYLVGSEKDATDGPLKEICNDYRGCLFRIQTLSDVREKVLSYVSVLSRPLAIVPGGPDPSWTPIYLDQLGLGLMITLVAPVFNRSENNGELLGVVGTDVALPQLERSIPGGEVGVNGYGFAINNNGFVVFHPGLDKKKDPPNIPLNELEYNGSGARELMQQMIDRSTGQMTFTNRLLFADKHRLSFPDKFHYFYSPVINTSFSAAVAIPELGLYSLNASNFSELNDTKVLESTENNEDVIVAPWEICPDTPVAAESTTPVYQPSYANARDIISDVHRVDHCDEPKLKNLFFDANVTQKVAEKWSANYSRHNAIYSVFVGTHGGIMRLLTTEPTTPFPSRDYIKEQFYTQAAQYANKGKGDNQTIVFSTPFKGASGYQAEVNDTIIITASSPIVVKSEDGANSVVAAVAGMRFNQKKMNETLLEVITENKCNSSEDCICQLIDDDGFILATNQPDEEVGKFFGLWEGAVLKEFLNQSFFDELTFVNVQGECKKPEQEASSARTLLNPLFAVTSYMQFWTQTVFWSLMQFNIYSFFSRGNIALAAEEKKTVPCHQQLRFYQGNRENRTTKNPKELKCPDDDSCEWPVFMAEVNGTNLRVVMTKRKCSCEKNEDTKLTTTPEDMLPSMPVPSNVSHRKPPEFKSPCDDMREEGKPPCALASLATPQGITVVFLLIVALLIPSNSHWR